MLWAEPRDRSNWLRTSTNPQLIRQTRHHSPDENHQNTHRSYLRIPLPNYRISLKITKQKTPKKGTAILHLPVAHTESNEEESSHLLRFV
jgi:hypothetical protein